MDDAPTAAVADVVDDRPSARSLGVAGALGIAAMLASGELLAGVFLGVPSPTSSVGTFVVDLSPPIVKDVAIGALGTNDKPALAIGTVVISLLVGYFAGKRSWPTERPALTAFAILGIVGLGAVLTQPLISPGLSVIAMLVAFGVGVLTLRRLIDVASSPRELSFGEPRDPTDGISNSPDRRRFLTAAVGTGVASAVAGTVGRRLLTAPASVDFIEIPDAAATLPPIEAANALDVPGITPIVIPNDSFYRIDTALVIPRVDPETWRMKIHGMVDNELEFSLTDLQAMPLVEQYVTIACVSNEVGGDLVGNAKWTGVPLTDLLERAGVQSGATQIAPRSVDGWTAGFPTELAFDGRSPLVAIGMNGEPLPRRHGFPARLIVPGLYGYVSATKWLSDIELTTWEDFDSYWVPRGWAKEGPIKTQSRIDVPRPSSRLEVGTNVVAGVAWAPLKSIAAVEVSVDGGPWISAVLSDPLSSAAWVQWRAEVELEPGIREIAVRATDGSGETQTDQIVPPRPDGATGYHKVLVRAGA